MKVINTDSLLICKFSKYCDFAKLADALLALLNHIFVVLVFVLGRFFVCGALKMLSLSQAESNE